MLSLKAWGLGVRGVGGSGLGNVSVLSSGAAVLVLPHALNHP